MNEFHESDALPKRTTPTWEVELLISGVAVFAMLQLPGWLDGAIFAMLPRVDRGMGSALMTMHVYLKSAALILATTFSIHLLLRAQWIALVGAYSVFPDGVRWSALRMGPIRKEVERRNEKAPAEATEAADNRATIVFALGVAMASALLGLSLSIGLMFLLVSSALRLLGIDADASRVFGFSAMGLMLPLIVAMTVDRYFAARLQPQGWLWRAAAAALAFYRTLGVSRGSNVLGLIASHGGEKRIGALTVAIVTIGMAAALFSTLWRLDPTSLGGYARFPSGDGSQVVDPAHYDDQRDPGIDRAVAYIQSSVVAGPYMKLVVPYRPGDDDAALRLRCPAVVAKPAPDAAVLACLTAVHAIRIDGKPLAGQAYEISEDPRTDRPALLAMIDVRALAPGRHVLTVERTSTSKNKKASEPYTIPFWR